jgi:major membrane immunogen (membrane-anchored lipoprotein)
MRKRLKVSTLAIVSLLVFNACGDSNKKTTINHSEIVRCTTGTFSTLAKGDKVTILVDDTEMDIRHAQNGEKKACVISGEAKIN